MAESKRTSNLLSAIVSMSNYRRSEPAEILPKGVTTLAEGKRLFVW
jgi:hypothetical protein